MNRSIPFLLLGLLLWLPVDAGAAPASSIQRGTTATRAAVCLPTPVPASIMGTIGYYRWRHQDFMQRHPDLTERDRNRIPDYYLDYGDKYITRFTRELYPKLSDKGQAWLVKARLNLQEAIEERRAADPRAFAQLEEDPKAFRSFAFFTHQQAYMDAGLATLPLTDLIKIGLTPDVKDLLSKDGRIQIFGISGKLGKAHLARLGALLRHLLDEAGKAVRANRPDLVQDAIILMAGLPDETRRMLAEGSDNFRELRRAIQFRLGHPDGTRAAKATERSWQRCLTSLSRLEQGKGVQTTH